MTVRQLRELLEKLPPYLDEVDISVSAYDAAGDNTTSKLEIRNIEHREIYSISGRLAKLELVAE